MNYLDAFRISAAGMALEKTRVNVTALNIANLHTTRTDAGGPYVPLRVVARAGGAVASSFPMQMQTQAQAIAAPLNGPELAGVVPLNVPPRMLHDPGHPDADANGMVAYPGLNQVNEMVTLMTALRAYEANVTAMNAAKAMTLKALDIGGAA